MPGGGTTNSGAFRFPYQFLDIAQEVRDKLEAMGMDQDWERIIDNFLALYMDRDRALEDYTTAAARPTFTTVAADGSGDYTTIKAALEAVPGSPGASQGPSVIYVKPVSGGYQESALGNVTLQSGIRVQVWAGLLSGVRVESSHLLLWQTGQWLKTGDQHIGVNGFQFQTAGVTTSLISNSSGGSTNGTLQLTNCHIICPLYNSTAGKSFFNYYLANCSGTLHGGQWTESLNWEVVNCSLALGSLTGGTWGFTCSGAAGTYSFVRFLDSTVTMGSFANINWTGGGDTTGNGRANSKVTIKNCQLGQSNSTVTITTCDVDFSGNYNSSNENSGQYTNVINFVDCGRTRNINQIPSHDYGSFNLSNNVLTGWNVSVTRPAQAASNLNGALTISGTYGKLTLGMDNTMCVVSLNQQFNNLPLLDVTGNKNLVLATMNRSAQGGDASAPVTVSGDNNYIIYTKTGFTFSHTDIGSGNVINQAGVAPLTAAIIDAKGDLLAGYLNDDVRRLAVGSDGQVLQADSTATLGVRWADPAHFEYDAKGDVLVATGDNAYDRYGVGADQRTLRADSASYVGVSWDYQRTLKNKLTANQASLETDTAGWAAESGCSIARNAANASHGTASLEIVKL